MQFANLDMITRRILLERNLPLHYYMEVLFHTSAAVRELNKDTLKMINTVKLALNDYYAADLPEDFKDDVGAYVAAGNLLQPIAKKDSINPLRQINSDGQFIPYSATEDRGEQTTFGFNGGWLWYWNVSDYGEPTGRFFGSGGGARQNGYKIIKERRQIQFTETFTADEAVLIYVSNGQHADNATQIEWDAFRAIQSFAEWRMSPNASMKDSYEGATYYNERRLLRANLNDLTLTDLRQILHEAYKATMKN